MSPLESLLKKGIQPDLRDGLNLPERTPLGGGTALEKASKKTCPNNTLSRVEIEGNRASLVPTVVPIAPNGLR